MGEIYRKMYNYHNIFEIRYLLYIRKLVCEVLGGNLPIHIIRTYIIPHVSNSFPEFSIYNSYQLKDSHVLVKLRRYVDCSTVHLHITRTNSGTVTISLHLYDYVHSITKAQPLTTTNNIRTISQIINYCFCYYKYSNTSMVKFPDVLRNVNLICRVGDCDEKIGSKVPVESELSSKLPVPPGHKTIPTD